MRSSGESASCWIAARAEPRRRRGGVGEDGRAYPPSLSSRALRRRQSRSFSLARLS